LPVRGASQSRELKPAAPVVGLSQVRDANALNPDWPRLVAARQGGVFRRLKSLGPSGDHRPGADTLA
jgi:hypothetical protein